MTNLDKISPSIVRYISAFMAFAIAFILALNFGGDIFSDPDVAWHLRAGELIFDSRTLPNVDTWSYASDQEWYLLSWTWDVLTYIVYKDFGYHGLFVLKSALFASIMFVIYLGLSGFHPFKSNTIAVVTAISGIALWNLFYLRPQLICSIYAFLFLLLLYRDSFKNRILLILLMVLWANTHGSFIVGFIVLGVFGLTALYDRDFAKFKSLLLLGCICVLATFINPLGYKLYIGVDRTMDSVIQPYISEWLPFYFSMEYGLTFTFLIFLIALKLENNAPKALRMLAYLMFILALIAKRNFGFYAMLSAPFIAYALDPFTTIKDKGLFRYRFSELLLIPVVLLSLLLSLLYFDKFPVKKVWVNPVYEDAITLITSKCKDPKIFNDYNLGGHLILYNKNNYKHFIDGRAGTAFTENLLEKSLKTLNTDEPMENSKYLQEADVAMLSEGLFNQVKVAEFFKKWHHLKDLQHDQIGIRVYINSKSKACVIN